MVNNFSRAAYASRQLIRREILAKRQQSGSTMVTPDDTESAACPPMPTGKENDLRRWRQLAVFHPRTAYWPPPRHRG